MRSRALILFLAAAGVLPAAAAPNGQSRPGIVRIATFNSSLNRSKDGELRYDLSMTDDAQARNDAEIIQRVNPDILLLQEFDFDVAGESLREFRTNYLAHTQNGAASIEFGYAFSAPSNTGVPSGFDLDRDGKIGGGGDALGFGAFPGQYGMVLLSKFPIERESVRTFRHFLWRDMPGALLPDFMATSIPSDWYSAEALAILPLSSKSHWDVPVRIGRVTLHLLASHPTPPAFDGPEDRNGLRNHDEIRFWNDYITPGKAGYIHDDERQTGGFSGKAFVIMGDQNSDPVDGGSRNDAIRALLANARVNSTFTPASEGAAEAAQMQGGANLVHKGDAHFDTGDFNDKAAGNLRVDYLLPSKAITVCGGGVFWPKQGEPLARLVWGDPPPSSDHRLVWIDVSADGARCPPGNDPTASASSRPDR